MRRLFRLVGRDAPVEGEIDAELEFHLETESERLVAAGLSPEAARIAARRRFGDMRRTRAELARIDRGRRMKTKRVSWLEDLSQDFRYAVRGFTRQPWFAAVIVVTLGLGIGANATMFGLVDRLMLQSPAHVADADRIARFQLTEHNEDFSQTWSNESLSWLTYTDQRDHAGYFSEIAAAFTQREMPLGRGEGAGRIPVTLATPSFFRLLGVRPEVGRFYGDAEDQPGSAQTVAVLSFRYATRIFGTPAAALGKQLFLGSHNYTVIGVAPKGFTGVGLNAVEVWVPFHAGARDVMGSDDWRTTYNWQWLNVIARLKPGVSRELASEEATRIQRAAVEKIPDVDHRSIAALVSLQGFDRKAVSHARERVALWLGSVSLIVLLIVCANVANLLLARAAGRRREIAVRLALGVGRGRLVRQLLAESILLAVGGGVVALVLARWGGQLLRATLLPNVDWVASPLDWRVGGITALVTLLTGLLTGIAPALQASRPVLTVALKTGAADAASPRSRLRTGLLATQACLSLVLLIGAGLFVKSLWRVVHTDTGYDPRNLLVASVDLDLAGFPRGDAQHAFYDQALERMRALPNVERASLAINSPFWTMNSTRIRLMDRDSTPRIPEGGPYYNGVTPEYFATLGMRLLRGRGFTAEDRAGSAPVMVINERMADFFWPGGQALGQCIKVGADSLPCVQVVGIVATARVDAIQEKPRAMYYVPLELSKTLGMSRDRMLFLRTRGQPAALIPEVRASFLSMAENLPFANVRTFQSQIDPEIQPWRLGAVMFGLFGGLALLVAALGLYSVMSYSVVQRTREFGIRSALGASARQIVRSVLQDGLRVVAVGMALGAVIALVGGRFLAPMLYQTSARDPVVFVVVMGTLLVASIVAVVVPARRATRVDPLEALKAD
jgi:predicted permease